MCWWYYNENTQENVELTEINISGLSGNSSYCWRVRYRDTSLGWSDWSNPLSFQTGESQYSDNLLINSGGEEGLLGWTVTEGYMESLEAYVCDGIEPYAGDYYFIVGALCNTATYAEAYQEVDISDYTECHDQILKLESEIKGLLSRKDSLMRTLKHIRNSEKHIVNKLQKKYGEDASIDLQKLEIIDGKA